MKDLTAHWNKIYINTEDDKLGWFEADNEQTNKFLNKIPDWKKSTIFIAGAGTSGLIDELLMSEAYMVINDLSTEVINKSKERYYKYRDRIEWLCQDLSMEIPPDLFGIDIWIDRAVLHFLVDDKQIDQYFVNVNSAIKPGGYALFAEFSKSGVTRCAGLDVRRYDIEDFTEKLPAFELISGEDYTYINPNGDPRPYIYALFKKTHNTLWKISINQDRYNLVRAKDVKERWISF